MTTTPTTADDETTATTTAPAASLPPLTAHRVAMEAGITAPTLRAYEKRGLLGHVATDPRTGTRRYTPEQRDKAAAAYLDTLDARRQRLVKARATLAEQRQQAKGTNQ